MKKFIVPLIACMLALAFAFGAMQTSAEGTAKDSNSIPDDALVTHGYLEQYKEQLKNEILAEIADEGVFEVVQTYNDISAKEGQTIILHADSEIIYRGGGAVAITSSNTQGEGIMDMSENTEIFSGMALEYGHIYYASPTDSKKAILITGETAYFTIRGGYELG